MNDPPNKKEDPPRIETTREQNPGVVVVEGQKRLCCQGCERLLQAGRITLVPGKKPTKLRKDRFSLLRDADNAGFLQELHEKEQLLKVAPRVQRQIAIPA